MTKTYTLYDFQRLFIRRGITEIRKGRRIARFVQDEDALKEFDKALEDVKESLAILAGIPVFPEDWPPLEDPNDEVGVFIRGEHTWAEWRKFFDSLPDD